MREFCDVSAMQSSLAFLCSVSEHKKRTNYYTNLARRREIIHSKKRGFSNFRFFKFNLMVQFFENRDVIIIRGTCFQITVSKIILFHHRKKLSSEF